MNLVIGETSGTTGVVEEGSSRERLILSNVSGEFLENEEILQGNKVSTIRQKGDVIGFSFIDKGTNSNTVDLSTETAIKISAIGSEVELTVAAGQITASASGIEITDSG